MNDLLVSGEYCSGFFELLESTSISLDNSTFHNQIRLRGCLKINFLDKIFYLCVSWLIKIDSTIMQFIE